MSALSVQPSSSVHNSLGAILSPLKDSSFEEVCSNLDRFFVSHSETRRIMESNWIVASDETGERRALYPLADRVLVAAAYVGSSEALHDLLSKATNQLNQKYHPKAGMNAEMGNRPGIQLALIQAAVRNKFDALKSILIQTRGSSIDKNVFVDLITLLRGNHPNPGYLLLDIQFDLETHQNREGMALHLEREMQMRYPQAAAAPAVEKQERFAPLTEVVIQR